MNYNCPYMQLKGQQYEHMQTFRTSSYDLVQTIIHNTDIWQTPHWANWKGERTIWG